MPLPADSGTVLQRIPVRISYEIIRLFSEGLYQSPQKAIEELVSNSYDANATDVRVLTPSAGAAATMEPLWVIDNGTGMDIEGFVQLWRVADSNKVNWTPEKNGSSRPPIGQFGIGKLAAYVLAWRLTHVSRQGDQILGTSMNFKSLANKHQYDNVEPIEIELRELSDEDARVVLADIKDRDPDAWQMMFGSDSSSNPSHVVAYPDGEVRQDFSICVTAHPVAGKVRASEEVRRSGLALA